MKETLVLLAKLLATDDAFNLAFSSAKNDEEKFELSKVKINDLTRDDFSEFLEKLREAEKSSLSDLSVDELQMVAGGAGEWATKLAAAAMFVTALGVTGIVSQPADALPWDESVALTVLDCTFNDGYVEQNPAALDELTALHSEITNKHILSIGGDPASYFAQKLPSDANQDVRSCLVAAYDKPETVLPSWEGGGGPALYRNVACRVVLESVINDYTRSAFLDYLIENVEKKADLERLRTFINNCYFPHWIKQSLHKIITVDDDANLSLDDIKKRLADANEAQREDATGQGKKKVTFTICHQLLKYLAGLGEGGYLTRDNVAKLKDRLTTDKVTRQNLRAAASSTIRRHIESVEERFPQIKRDGKIDTAIGAVQYSSDRVRHIVIGDFDRFGCWTGGGHTSATVATINDIQQAQFAINPGFVPAPTSATTRMTSQGCPVATMTRAYSEKTFDFFPDSWTWDDIEAAIANCIAHPSDVAVNRKEKKILYKFHPDPNTPAVADNQKPNVNQVSVFVVIGYTAICFTDDKPVGPYSLVTCFPLTLRQESGAAEAAKPEPSADVVPIGPRQPLSQTSEPDGSGSAPANSTASQSSDENTQPQPPKKKKKKTNSLLPQNQNPMEAADPEPSAAVVPTEISKSKKNIQTSTSRASRTKPEVSSLEDMASASSISTSQPETQTPKKKTPKKKKLGYTIEEYRPGAENPSQDTPSPTEQKTSKKIYKKRNKAPKKSSPPIKNSQLFHRNKAAEQKQSPPQNSNDNQIAQIQTSETPITNDDLDITITSGPERHPALWNKFIFSVWNYLKALWNYLKPW